MPQINKRYYEKLDGFSYVLDELRKKIGTQQTDVLMTDAVNLCNGLCEKYKGLPKKEKIYNAVTKIPFIRPLFFKIFPGMIHTMFNEEAGFKTKEYEFDNKHYRVDVLQCPYMKYCELLGCK